jgi:hypothetical protein
MTALSIQVPFPVFQDRDGQPLDNGYVWIGTANLNPQTNPVATFYDAALTIPAAQPLRTLNGFISNAGTPAQVYIDAVNFSILVQDSKGSMIYSFPDGTGISPNASGVTYDPVGVGAVPMTVQTKLRQNINVADYGAVGNGVTDDTAAIQAALTAAGVNGSVDFNNGVFIVSSTLYGLPNQTLRGGGSNSTLIKRTGNYGDTLVFGGLTTACGHVCIYDMWFKHGSADYTKGINSLPDLATSGAHIRLYGSQQAIISNVWMWRLPYQLVFESGSLGMVEKCHFYGIWDNVYPDAQEGIAQLLLKGSPALGIVTSTTIRDCFFTGDASLARNVVFTPSTGNVTKSITDVVGSQYGVQITDSEDLDMTGCYLSSHSNSSVLIDNTPADPAFELRFFGNFFDVAKFQSINISPVNSQSSYINITGNTFNGEGTGLHAINVNSSGGGFSSHSSVIANNNFLAHIGTPILLAGLYASNVSGNTFTSYNILNVSPSDPSYCSAVYVTDQSANLTLNNNVVGYGTYCFLGITVQSGLTNVSQYGNINVNVPETAFSQQAFSLPNIIPCTQSLIGILKAVNFNVTTDQAIPITLVGGYTNYRIDDIVMINASIPLTTAAGGIYPTISKGGNPYVAATQVYTTVLNGATAFLSLTTTNIGGLATHNDPTLYFSLTTAQGVAATADIYVFGTPIN